MISGTGCSGEPRRSDHPARPNCDLLSVSARLPRWLRQADLSLLIRVVERIGDFAQIAA
jgi:hypothetical protein